MTSVARTASGQLQGREKSGVLLFAGIPYAAPPVEGRRFRAPEPHEGWTGVREARKFGPAAPQVATGGMTDPAPVRWDEDCLTLNVQTPGLDDAGRPVLVWIHGGGYRNGQGAVPWYNGARFAANGDIVAVTINYRLGALGFTDLSRFGPEFATSGVNGILDQIAALEWVRDNIAFFGGDPSRVTIAGESAGGFSVATLLGSPRAEGLFRGAIPQSGAAHHVLPKRAGDMVADRFLDALGVDGPVGLEAASVDAVLEAQGAVIEALDRRPGLQTKLGVPVSTFYPTVGSDAGSTSSTGVRASPTSARRTPSRSPSRSTTCISRRRRFRRRRPVPAARRRRHARGLDALRPGRRSRFSALLAGAARDDDLRRCLHCGRRPGRGRTGRVAGAALTHTATIPRSRCGKGPGGLPAPALPYTRVLCAAGACP